MAKVGDVRLSVGGTAASAALRRPTVGAGAPPGLIWPLSEGGRTDAVIRRLGAAIHLGLLADGEQLPPEAEFAHQLGVSPMTLREALSGLRQHGLVETRRGRTGGTFVRRPSNPTAGQLLGQLQRFTIEQVADLSDLQLAIDGTAAMLAAQRATRPMLRRLFALAEELAGLDEPGPQLRTDTRFHIELAVAAQSERLLQTSVALQSETGGIVWAPSDPPWSASEAGEEHRAVVLAIEARDAERARRLVEEHLRRNQHRLSELHHLLSVGG